MTKTNYPKMMEYNVHNNNVGVSGVAVSDSGLSRYFQRYLLQRAFSIFEWRIPEHWSMEYLLYSVYCWGHVAVVNTNAFGVIPQCGTLCGFDVFYRPTNVQITNPLLRGIMSPRIGRECEIIRLQPDYGGIMDIVTFHADMMALCAQTAGVNLANSKLSYVFAARNKNAALSFDRMYSDIMSGKPAVVVDKDLFNEDGSPSWEPFEQNVGQNYIAGQILDDLRKWEQRFLTAIGIPNANTEKKERLITDEVNANNAETKSLSELWLETLQKSIERVLKIFPGLPLSVDWREEFKPAEKKDGDKKPDKEEV